MQPAARPPPARARRSRARRGQPSVADSLAGHGADSHSDAIADAGSGDAEPDAHATDGIAAPGSGDAEPDGHATDPRANADHEIVRAYFLLHDTPARIRPSCRCFGPCPGAGDGNGRDEGAARGTIGQGASGIAADRDVHPGRLEAPRDRDRGGLATVDLSAEFASLSPDDAWDPEALAPRRLAQVAYTMTQFATMDRVNFKLDGKPVTVFSSEKIALAKPVTRATYRERYMPLIFVDRPAWGAALADPRAGHRARQRL